MPTRHNTGKHYGKELKRSIGKGVFKAMTEVIIFLLLFIVSIPGIIMILKGMGSDEGESSLIQCGSRQDIGNMIKDVLIIVFICLLGVLAFWGLSLIENRTIVEAIKEINHNIGIIRTF